MGSFFRWLVGDTVKTGLCWLGYRYRKPIVTAAVRGAEAALDHPYTQEVGRRLLGHYRASRWQFLAAVIALIAAAIGGIVFGTILRFPMELGMAQSLRFWGGVTFISFGAIAVGILFYITMKIVLVRGLLTFILATIGMGYRAAVGILPNIIGYHLQGLVDPIVEPIAKLANLIEFYALTVVMAVGTVWMFCAVFGIHLNWWAFPLATVAIITLVTVVIRDRKPPVWLRLAAIAMSVVSLVVAATVSSYPYLRTANGIREDCFEWYYFEGVPKDTDKVKLCEANMPTATMNKLKRFNELRGQMLSSGSRELAEYNALDTVLKGDMDHKPKPFVVHSPPAPKLTLTVTLPATAPATTPAPKPKPPKAKQTSKAVGAATVMASSGANSAQAERFRALEAKYGIH